MSVGFLIIFAFQHSSLPYLAFSGRIFSSTNPGIVLKYSQMSQEDLQFNMHFELDRTFQFHRENFPLQKNLLVLSGIRIPYLLIAHGQHFNLYTSSSSFSSYALQSWVDVALFY